MKHDHWITDAAQAALGLMLRETNLDLMQPCRSMKVFRNRKKRIDQVLSRAMRCGVPA